MTGYELLKVGDEGLIANKYYLLTWWYGLAKSSTANIAKGINSMTNKTSDGF